MQSDLRDIHEYQADEAVIFSCKNPQDLLTYQKILIEKAAGTRFHSLTDSLNHSKLKKRLTMMYKKKATPRRKAAVAALFPAMLLGALLVETPASAVLLSRIRTVSVPTSLDIAESMGGTKSYSTIESTNADKITKKTGKKQPMRAVEEPAEFPGGMKNLISYLSSHIVYPVEAQNAGEEGRVIVEFIIGKDGRVRNPTIKKGVSETLDREALRVVGEMPAWIPGKSDGKPVDSYYVLPVSFKLTESGTAEE